MAARDQLSQRRWWIIEEMLLNHSGFLCFFFETSCRELNNCGVFWVRPLLEFLRWLMDKYDASNSGKEKQSVLISYVCFGISYLNSCIMGSLQKLFSPVAEGKIYLYSIVNLKSVQIQILFQIFKKNLEDNTKVWMLYDWIN